MSPNRLASENSPYLLQHKDNPVDWYPWGPEALHKARQENKPIFLSIGYAACHWCHVMAHESFEDPNTAGLMNEYFVNIKVDREQRPDLDSIYMKAVVALTGQGGWPMSVFLTPEGAPFFGGTYFPPVRRYQMPAFSDILLGVVRAWQEERDKLVETSQELIRHVAQNIQMPAASHRPLHPGKLDEAAARLSQTYDWDSGGWGKAPKFPQAMSIEFLLLRAAAGDQQAAEISNHALRSMAQGGMYDLVGGGFARYSTDNDWLVPHFEKMLYDNALLGRAYLHAYLLSGNLEFRRVCESTLDFMLRELLAAPDEEGLAGGFYSSLDADSEGEEGKYYLWTAEEVTQALIAIPGGAELALAAYGFKLGGNFEGRTIPRRMLDDNELAQRFGLDAAVVPARLAEINQALLTARSLRIRPGTDDKVLTAWNGLALILFAEAGRYLQRPDYLATARRTADFLLSELHPHDRLLRAWRAGIASHNAYLEDYAALILGLLALYQSDPDPYWYNSAMDLKTELLAHYSDPVGGFYDTRDDQSELILRPREVQDNATPSGGALAALALLQLSALSGDLELRDQAAAMFSQVEAVAVQYPTAFAYWLQGMHALIHPYQEVALVGELNSLAAQELLQTIWGTYRPGIVLAASNLPIPDNAPPLLQDRPLLNDQPTVYVCENFVCRRPVTRSSELAELLQNNNSQ